MTALAAVVLVGLAGCGQVAAPQAQVPRAPQQASLPGIPEADASPAVGPHNEYDILFLQMMIAHQAQGLEMLELGKAKATRPDVGDLAAAIDAVEAEEVRTMQRWLKEWNVTPAASTDTNIHASHGGSPATGPAEIQALKDASGPDFETKFLNLLIGHQHNAVEMAQQIATTGQNATVKKFAERITLSRTQQIKQMLTLVSG